MRPLRYRAVGGAILTDFNRPVALEDAGPMVGILGRWALRTYAAGNEAVARQFATDALDLHRAHDAALRWQRAAA